MALQNSSSIPSLLAELGQVEQALAEAGPVADRIEAGGDMSWLSPRGVQLRLLVETGAGRHAPDPTPLLAAARQIGLPDVMADAFTAGARVLLAQGHPEHARALLAELDESPAVRAAGATFFLPELVRAALTLGATEFAERLVGSAEPRTPMAEYALTSARAQLAEADGSYAAAARLYGEASERWGEFGNAPEHAYALLGQGRCLVALGDTAAAVALAEARDQFVSMGYRPTLAETDELLAAAVAETA